MVIVPDKIEEIIPPIYNLVIDIYFCAVLEYLFGDMELGKATPVKGGIVGDIYGGGIGIGATTPW